MLIFMGFVMMIYESHVYFNVVLEYKDDNYEYVLLHDLECYAFNKI